MPSPQPDPPTATADPDSLERLQRPRLAPTYRVVGKFEAPQEVQGNFPDLRLIREARQILGYKTNYTLLEWWEIFPVGKWWRYAIAATKYYSTRPNYRYFLRSMLSAARETKVYQECAKALQHLTRVDVRRELQGEKPVRPVCRVCNGSGCENCDPAVVKARDEAHRLGVRVECSHCRGEVCMDCLGQYITLIQQAKESPPKLSLGVSHAPPPVPQ